MGAARMDTFLAREAHIVKSCLRQYSACCVLRLATQRPCSDSPWPIPRLEYREGRGGLGGRWGDERKGMREREKGERRDWGRDVRGVLIF